MKNLQRGIRVCALIALFLSSFTLIAQESTEEATPEATPVVEETVAPEETTEATAEATDAAETTPEATAEMTPEATPESTASAEVTPEATDTLDVQPTPIPTLAPIAEVEGSTATVVGSGIVNPALQAIITDSGTIVDYTVTTTGTDAGIEAFCAGQADIVTTARPLSVEEDTLCREAGVTYYELLLGYHVSVVISNFEDDYLACLSTNNLQQLLAPSAEGSTLTWADVALPDTSAPNTATPTPAPEATAEATPEVTEEPLPAVSVLLPADTSIAYATMDDIVPGFGLRGDAQTADVQTIIDTVATTPGAIGVVPLEAALNAAERVFPLEIDFGAGCTAAAIETAEDETYRASQTMYVNVNQSAQDTVALLLEYITSGFVIDSLIAADYTPTSTEVLELNRSIILGEVAARANTEEEVTYQVSPNLAGALTVVGAGSGFPIADGVANQLTQTRQQLTINRLFNGQAAGITEFCTGDADVLFVNGATENICAGTEATVDYNTFPVGDQAVVLVANAMDSYATCLTQEQIITIWQSASGDTVTQWSGVAEVFPEQSLTLVGISAGNFLTDILLTPADGGAPLAARVDVAETNNDPLYRAAAIANVPGALTYMSWADYQTVVENGQANTQLVAIDAGSGCVVPSEETITNGSYPLTRSTSMLVKSTALANEVGQGFVWTIYTDSVINQLEALDFVTGFTDRSLSDFRSDLLVEFDNAEEAARAAAEATAEATAEVTAEATAEATEAAGE